MDSARPFQVAAIATFLTSVALLYAWLRERTGELAALGGAALVLFLGAAWEDLLWAFQIGYFGSMAAGIGMLLALRRESPRGRRGRLRAAGRRARLSPASGSRSRSAPRSRSPPARTGGVAS